MARGSWIYDRETGQLVPKHEFMMKKAVEASLNRSSLRCPPVIGAMPETRSPIDGRIYTDKSSYYRHVERAGCAIIGYDKNWTDYVAKSPLEDTKAHQADIVADVKKSIEQLKSGTAQPISPNP